MSMTAPVQAELSAIYKRVAASECVLGTPKKTIDEIVARALDIPFWRARAIRLGEAGCSSAAFVLRVQNQFKLFLEKRTKSSAAKAIARAQFDRAELEAARHEFRTQLTRVEQMLARLDTFALPVEDMDRP